MNRLAEHISLAARQHARRTAVVCRERRQSFAEVDAHSDPAASAQIHSGAAKGDRIGLYLPNTPEFVTADLALIKAGLVRLPLNPRLIPAEIGYILENAGAAVLLFAAEYSETVAAIAPRLPGLRHLVCVGGPAPAWATGWDELLARGTAPWAPAAMSDDDPYMLAYTSGTTGRPKGVLTSYRSRWAMLLHTWSNENFYSSADVMLHIASLCHGSGTKVLPHFLKGACNVLLPKWSPEAFCRTVQTERVSTTWMVPATILQLLDYPDRRQWDLSSLRTVVYAGAPMPAARLQEALREFGPIFVQVYGLNEVPHPDLVLPKEDHVLDGTEQQQLRLTSAGRPCTGVDVRVVGEGGREVPWDGSAVGEIVLRGEHAMVGYWQNPEATAEVVRDGWVHTGDMATVDEEGYIYIVDRKKDMIISGGFNVYPREVEEVLHRHPAVWECAVIGVPDPIWGEAVKAIVSLRSGWQATAEELIDFARQHLAGYKKPRSVDFLPELPKNSNGKIAKKELRGPYWRGMTRKI